MMNKTSKALKKLLCAALITGIVLTGFPATLWHSAYGNITHAEAAETTEEQWKTDIKNALDKVTAFDDDKYVFSALKYGASGYLLKGISVDELEKAIHVVYGGGAMINPEIASKVVELFSEMAQQNYDVMIEAENVEKINDMEWDIIKDVGHGMSNKEIADHIGLTEGTVRNYISTILKKIGLRDRTQLAIWEVQSGAQKRRG